MIGAMSLPSSSRVVITGAGSGLGKALALELASRGARLLLSDVRVETAEATAREALSTGAREAVAMGCDVSSLPDVEALAERSRKLWGGLDLLVNNAGIGAGGLVGEASLETWKKTLDINLWGVIYGCHVFVPLFKAQGSGHILNVASVAGLIYAPQMGPYNVSKAGVVALSETLKVELARHNVGVTVLCPSFFQTGIMDNATGVDDRGQRFARSQMAKSSLDARGVARAALASVDASTLHSVPMRDARWMWRMRRLSPALFVRAAINLHERVLSRGKP